MMRVRWVPKNGGTFYMALPAALMRVIWVLAGLFMHWTHLLTM